MLVIPPILEGESNALLFCIAAVVSSDSPPVLLQMPHANRGRKDCDALGSLRSATQHLAGGADMQGQRRSRLPNPKLLGFLLENRRPDDRQTCVRSTKQISWIACSLEPISHLSTRHVHCFDQSLVYCEQKQTRLHQRIYSQDHKPVQNTATVHFPAPQSFQI